MTTPDQPATDPGTADPRPRVVVAMLTFRRPEFLARALPAVAGQCAQLTAAHAELLVVDNDPDAGARAAVTASGARYVHEPRPGIAAGRNAALAAAGDAGAVVFVDDDEVPAPGWLAALVGAWREWGCAAVAGPARRTLDGPASPWVVQSGFLGHPQRPTGTRVAGAATNNLLLDLAVLRATGLTFDERFGLTGGSDTMLTRALTRAGHEIRWCAEAEVCDPVPADRATRSWVLRRSYRTGTTWSRVHVALRADPPATAPRGPLPPSVRTQAERLELTARALVRLGGGVAGVAAARLARRSPAAAECRVAAGAGMLAGAWGVAYTEYRRGPDRRVPDRFGPDRFGPDRFGAAR